MNDLAAEQTMEQPRARERRGTRQPAKPQSRTQLALTLVCLAGSLAVMFPAAEMALAGLASYRAELALQRWNKTQRAPDQGKWQAALRAAQQTNTVNPVASGTYLDQLGQVYAWQAFDQAVGAESARPSRLLAAAAFRQATAARPTWPNTWAHLAHSKYALGEFDEEFAQALKEADRLGPNRPDVQLELASIGLRAWPMLTQQQRVDAVTSARQAMDSTNEAAKSLFALAQASGLEQTLCTSGVDESDSTRNYCTRGGNR